MFSRVWEGGVAHGRRVTFSEQAEYAETDTSTKDCLECAWFDPCSLLSYVLYFIESCTSKYISFSSEVEQRLSCVQSTSLVQVHITEVHTYDSCLIVFDQPKSSALIDSIDPHRHAGRRMRSATYFDVDLVAVFFIPLANATQLKTKSERRMPS